MLTYYEENIGKVTSVDDFLADPRLYTYALKAYGLSDQASSKGFIRKVIESDLKDSASFANKLNDSRYRDFASAFNFNAGSRPRSRRATGQMESMIEAYSERSIRGFRGAAAKTSAFAQASAASARSTTSSTIPRSTTWPCSRSAWTRLCLEGFRAFGLRLHVRDVAVWTA